MEIQRRIAQMASEISRDYEGKTILLIAVLKGAFVFTADLLRRLDRQLVKPHVDFFRASSYKLEDKSSGDVAIEMEVTERVENTHVILVDDILDSGRTLLKLKTRLLNRNPASISSCVLLDKPERREVDIHADYIGFQIPNRFVVGYGLDYAEQFRYLPFIAVLDPNEEEQ